MNIQEEIETKIKDREATIRTFSLEPYLGKGEEVRKIERKLITQEEENQIMEGMIKRLEKQLND